MVQSSDIVVGNASIRCGRVTGGSVHSLVMDADGQFVINSITPQSNVSISTAPLTTPTLLPPSLPLVSSSTPSSSSTLIRAPKNTILSLSIPEGTRYILRDIPQGITQIVTSGGGELCMMVRSTDVKLVCDGPVTQSYIDPELQQHDAHQPVQNLPVTNPPTTMEGTADGMIRISGPEHTTIVKNSGVLGVHSFSTDTSPSLVASIHRLIAATRPPPKKSVPILPETTLTSNTL